MPPASVQVGMASSLCPIGVPPCVEAGRGLSCEARATKLRALHLSHGHVGKSENVRLLEVKLGLEGTRPRLFGFSLNRLHASLAASYALRAWPSSCGCFQLNSGAFSCLRCGFISTTVFFLKLFLSSFTRNSTKKFGRAYSKPRPCKFYIQKIISRKRSTTPTVYCRCWKANSSGACTDVRLEQGLYQLNQGTRQGHTKSESHLEFTKNIDTKKSLENNKNIKRGLKFRLIEGI